MATPAMEHKETELMLSHEVMMPADLLMGIARQNLYDPVEWVKIQAEVIPMIYELVRTTGN